MKQISILCFLVMLFNACFEDKGNYDYENIHQLNVTFPEVIYNVTFGEMLDIEASLGSEMASDTSRYEYTWRIDDEVLKNGNTRFLSWHADRIVKNGNVSLEVKDTKTGVVYSNRSRLNVIGIYENDYSWMILSDNNGKSQLSYFSCLEYDYDEEAFVQTKFYEDVYANANEGELGSGPIALQEHYREGVDWNDEVIGNVCVFQKSGAVDLNGESFEKEIEMKEAFDGYPEGIVLHPGTFMDFTDVLVDQEGRLYSRIKAVSTVFNSDYFLPEPLTFEGEVLEKCQIAYGYYRSNRTGYNFIYDGGKERMLYVLNNTNNYYSDIEGAGRIEALPACGGNDNINHIIPLNDLSGYEVIRIVMFGYSYPDYGIFMCLRDEVTDQIYVQLVTVTGSSGKPTVVEVKRYEVKGLPNTPQTATLSLSRPDFVFFSVGPDVYLFSLNNPENPVRLYQHFDSPVTVVNAEAENGEHMAVGLENGEFYVLNIYRAHNIPADKRIIYHSDVKVGRIVDIKYKNLDHWNY